MERDLTSILQTSLTDLFFRPIVRVKTSVMKKLILLVPALSIILLSEAQLLKKIKDKAFARAVNRDDIIRGAEGLGMPLDDVIAQVIAALKGDAARLGLVGAS